MFRIGIVVDMLHEVDKVAILLDPVSTRASASTSMVSESILPNFTTFTLDSKFNFNVNAMLAQTRPLSSYKWQILYRPWRNTTSLLRLPLKFRQCPFHTLNDGLRLRQMHIVSTIWHFDKARLRRKQQKVRLQRPILHIPRSQQVS